MSKDLCQFCEKNEKDPEFISRCGHKFHEVCVVRKQSANIKCPVCGTNFSKSQMSEIVLCKAREEDLWNYDELEVFFEEVEKYWNLETRIIHFDKNLLETAIRLGFNLKDVYDDININILRYICKNDLVHKLNILFELGLEFNKETAIWKTFFNYAINCNAFCILEKLITPQFQLENSYYNFDFRMIKWLLEKGIDINQNLGESKNRIIHKACEMIDIDAINLLLDNGAEIEVKDYSGFSPFHIIVKRFREEFSSNLRRISKTVIQVLERFLDLRADIESVNEKNETPLFTAIEKQSPTLVAFLLSKGANINAQKIKENGLICCYLLEIYKTSKESQSEYIKDYQMDINEKDSEGQNCLHKLMDNKFEAKYVEIMIKNGADVNCQDLKGNTPLHLLSLITNYDHQKFRFLIRYGANAFLKNAEGETALVKFLCLNDNKDKS